MRLPTFNINGRQGRQNASLAFIALLAACILLYGSLSSIQRHTPADIGLIAKDFAFLSLLEAFLPSMTTGQLEDLYFAIVRHRQIECRESKRIGGNDDGGWDVCFSGPFDIRKKNSSCVAFSFGINYYYYYDDALVDTYKCRVYMFDPSMTKVENHQRRKTSWFYKIGVSSSNYVQTGSNWTMRTLCTLLQDIAEVDATSNAVVDILKVDVEFWEWESFERALQEGCLSRVKQLLFESHTAGIMNARSDYQRYIRVWMGLFKAGFRTWKWHENPVSSYYKHNETKLRRACCYEHYLVNTAFL